MNTPDEYGSIERGHSASVALTTDPAETSWLQTARDAFNVSTDYFDANIRKQIEKNIDLFYSKHPAGSKYHLESYKYRSKGFRPKIRSVIRRHEAAAVMAFFATSELVDCKAEDPRDENALDGARYGKNWLEFRLEHSIPWFKTVVGAYQDGMVQGIVISRQEWVYKEKKIPSQRPLIGPDKLVEIDEDGEIVTESYDEVEVIVDKPDIVLVPVENFRFSAAADWRDPVGTSPFLIEMIPMYVGDVKERMKHPVNKGSGKKWKTLDDNELMSGLQSGTLDSTRMKREKGRSDSHDENYLIRDFDIVWVHRNIIRKDSEDQIYYTLGVNHLLSDPEPLENVFQHGRPYVIGSPIIETHKTFASGLPELLESLSDESNDLSNQRRDNIKLHLNKRYRARRGAAVDWAALKTSVPGGIILMDNLDDIKEEQFSDVTSSVYQEQDRINADFDELAGNFSSSSVHTNRSMNETVGGMAMALDDSNQISEYQLRTLAETWAEQVMKQLIIMCRHYETDERILTIIGDGRDPQEVSALLDTIYNTRIDVGFGSTSPQMKIQRLAMGLDTIAKFLPGDMQRVNGDEVRSEVFGALGYRDGSRFFFPREGDDPQIEQLNEKIQQLEQMLASKELDNQTKLQIAQIREQGQTERKQMEGQLKQELAQIENQLKYIAQQVMAEKNDIARGELLLQQEALAFQKREKEIAILTNQNDRMSGVLMRDNYGKVPAAEG